MVIQSASINLWTDKNDRRVRRKNATRKTLCYTNEIIGNTFPNVCFLSTVVRHCFEPFYDAKHFAWSDFDSLTHSCSHLSVLLNDDDWNYKRAFFCFTVMCQSKCFSLSWNNRLSEYLQNVTNLQWFWNFSHCSLNFAPSWAVKMWCSWKEYRTKITIQIVFESFKKRTIFCP